jgi:hypothetical protein
MGIKAGNVFRILFRRTFFKSHRLTLKVVGELHLEPLETLARIVLILSHSIPRRPIKWLLSITVLGDASNIGSG